MSGSNSAIAPKAGSGHKFKLTLEGKELDYNTDRDVHYCIRGYNKRDGITSFSDSKLGFENKLLENVEKAGLKKPTPIQRHGMPRLVSGLDVMCLSHTGSGKTAAYLLPIINNIVRENVISSSSRPKPASESGNVAPTIPKALILTPTHELAMQISKGPLWSSLHPGPHTSSSATGKDANLFGNGLPVESFAVFGGQNMSYELKKLKEGKANILVATPGKLLHLLSEFPVVSVAEVKYFVVDEADDMFDRGFFPEIRTIIDQFLPPKEERVNALLSATFPNQIQYFAKKQLRSEFIYVVIGILGGASPDVCQEIVCASRFEKLTKFHKLVERMINDDKKILVFCNTIEKVKELVDFLQYKEFEVGGIHSELTQPERTQSLKDFDSGHSNVLIATSVAARGLNITGVDLVLNYELPTDINDYIQRIGRTGRVGVVGETLSFYDEDVDADLAKDLVTALKSGNQTVPEFLSTACAGDINEKEFEMSEEVLYFKMKKLNIKRPLDTFEEEDAW